MVMGQFVELANSTDMLAVNVFPSIIQENFSKNVDFQS